MGTDNNNLLCLKIVVIAKYLLPRRHRSYGSLRWAILTFSQNFKNTSSPPREPMNKGLEAVRFASKPHPKVPRTSPLVRAPVKTIEVELIREILSEMGG